MISELAINKRDEYYLSTRYKMNVARTYIPMYSENDNETKIELQNHKRS